MTKFEKARSLGCRLVIRASLVFGDIRILGVCDCSNRLEVGAWAAHHQVVKIEHVALQVADPVPMAEWYVTHMKLSVTREAGAPTHQRFLSDDSGAIMIEFYRNPRVAVPDYANMDPLLLHIAFVSETPAADRDRLVQGGAKVVEDLTTAPNGDGLVMLRDPWGVALQLVKRTAPMLRQGI